MSAKNRTKLSAGVSKSKPLIAPVDGETDCLTWMATRRCGRGKRPSKLGATQDSTRNKVADRIRSFVQRCADHDGIGFIFVNAQGAASSLLTEWSQRERRRGDIAIEIPVHPDPVAVFEQIHQRAPNRSKSLVQTVAPETTLLVDGIHHIFAANPAINATAILAALCRIQQSTRCGLIFSGRSFSHDVAKTSDFITFLGQADLLGRAYILNL